MIFPHVSMCSLFAFFLPSSPTTPRRNLPRHIWNNLGSLCPDIWDKLQIGTRHKFNYYYYLQTVDTLLYICKWEGSRIQEINNTTQEHLIWRSIACVVAFTTIILKGPSDRGSPSLPTFIVCRVLTVQFSSPKKDLVHHPCSYLLFKLD